MKQQIILKKSIISWILVFCMILGMMPITANADTATLTTTIPVEIQTLIDSGFEGLQLKIEGVNVIGTAVKEGEAGSVNVNVYIDASDNADTATLSFVWDNASFFPSDLDSPKTVDLTDGKGSYETSMKDKYGITSVSTYEISIDISPACTNPDGDDHTYGDAVITKEPTFTEEGEASYTCTCGKTKIESVAVMPHLITKAYYLDANKEKQNIEYNAIPKFESGNGWGDSYITPLYTFDVPENVTEIYLEYTNIWSPDGSAYQIFVEEDGSVIMQSEQLNEGCSMSETELKLKIPVETVLGLEKYACVFDTSRNWAIACMFKFDAEHIWDEGKETKAPTCIEDGETTYTCTYCAEVDEIVTKTEPIEATGHTFVKEVVDEKYLAAKADFNNGAKYYKSCECGEKGSETFTSGEALGVAITNNVKTEIANYKKVDDYREEQKAELAAIIEAANKAIEAATSEDEIKKAVEEAKTAMDKVKTDVQLKAEEEANKPVETQQLTAPVKVKVSNVAKSGKIKVTWKKVEGAAKYKVYRATKKNGKYKLVKTVTGTSYTDSSKTAGKSFYYKVKAVSPDQKVKASEFSKIVKGTVDLKRPVVTAKSKTKKQVKLTWKKVSSAKKYEIYRATKKNGKYKKIATTTKLSYTNKKLKSGKTYYYKVKAVAKKKAANSAFSEVDKCKSK